MAGAVETARSVLIVDDDPDVRDALEAVLEARGCFVATCADGLAAARLLVGGYRPSVIILDLMMPRVDGAWFREMQLRDRALAGIPVVVVTAFSNLARDAESVLAGVPIVFKPFEIDDLLRAMDLATAGVGRQIRSA